MIVSESLAMRNTLSILEKVAPFDETVLMTGESGVGKSLLAEYIHSKSLRKKDPFVAFNAAALSESLMESELFGHEKGAFTGAEISKPGRFELVEEGTIFIDELSELSLGMQTKLLRVLQERIYERVGSVESREMKGRIIAATNRDLKKMVADGEFREDLYYRIVVIPINVPPLRERKEDILPMVNFYVGKLARKYSIPNVEVDEETQSWLLKQEWPGNVRQLINYISRFLILGDQGKRLILEEELELPSAKVSDKIMTEQELLQQHALAVYQSTGENKTQTAKLLNIDVKTLKKRLQKEES